MNSSRAGLLAPLLALDQITSLEDLLAVGELELMLSRVLPITLYAEIAIILLQPVVRSLWIVLPFQLDRAILGSPLPLDQSLQVIWPHLTGLIAATILLFALGLYPLPASGNPGIIRERDFRSLQDSEVSRFAPACWAIRGV